ncbi:MAG: sigma-70 family RNA polymerase sigma factor [Planctomycetota bacterium]
MVLAKLLSAVANPKLQSGQKVRVVDLDAWLDVATDRFPATVSRLARKFADAAATLDLAACRDQRLAANPAAMTELPEVREALYQQDLRRIVPMDRVEEFRMARRYEFLVGLVRRGLEQAGIPANEAAELTTGPVPVALARLETLPARKAVRREWLATMIRQLDELRRLYVEGALSIVLTTVHRYRGLGVDTADLIQEGNASLYQAIDGFDWRRDVRFRTYAQFWVHQAVLKTLYNSSRTVRVPIWVQKILGKIRRAQDEARRAGAEPSHADIAARIGVPVEKVGFVLGTRRYAVSLDAPGGRDDGVTLAETLADDDQIPVPEMVPAGDLRASLDAAMHDLPVREQSILRRRFGLDGSEPATLGEIAADLGVTAERVRQLQNAALGRMQRPAKLRQLQAFVE